MFAVDGDVTKPIRESGPAFRAKANRDARGENRAIPFAAPAIAAEYPGIWRAAKPQARESVTSTHRNRREREAQMHNRVHNGHSAPYALWFLRLTLAIALLVHVQFNLGAFHSAAVMHWLGLPAGVSLFAITLEIAVAFALILGIWPRVAALTVAGVLLHAIMVTRGASAMTAAHFHAAAPAAWIGALLLLSLAGDGAFTLVPTAARTRNSQARR